MVKLVEDDGLWACLGARGLKMVSKFLGFMKKEEPAEDPVCHMMVSPSKPPGGSFEYEGTTYYFCGPGCRVAFSKEPEAYLSGEKSMDM